MSQCFSIGFVGDISLNDWYETQFNAGKSPFEKVEPLLKEVDLVLGNLECMARGNTGENERKVPRLGTSSDALGFLSTLRVTAVTLAHNHVYDHLESGFEITTARLQELGVQYLGAGLSRSAAARPLVVESNGVRLAVLNYVATNTNPKIPDGAGLKVNWLNVDQIALDIKLVRNDVHHVVLCLHWGGDSEGVFYPSIEQSEMARQLIRYGADLIVGHHPHVLQPMEVFDGKYVFHSLGNFCFADIPQFGYEVNRDRAVKSILLKVSFTQADYEVQWEPIENADGLIQPGHHKVLEHVSQRFESLKRSPIARALVDFEQKYIFPVRFYLCGNDRKLWQQLRKIKLEKVRYYLSR